MQDKEYYIGIDYGTSNSCVGIYMNSTVKIAPNRIGERTTPSLVLFSGNKIFVGEDVITQTDEENKMINEVKRFIGLDYYEFKNKEFSKHLNYEVINQDGKPKIKIVINGKEDYYSAEEISALIIKKMVSNAEDFINEIETGVKIGKAVMTVPVHFSEKQKEALHAAARMADIEVTRIINEPTAAALAYGLGEDLILQKENYSKRSNKLTNIGKSTCEGVPPTASEAFKFEKKIVVFDLGGGTFDITLLNISTISDNLFNFEVIGTNGETDLGGSDFDNLMVDYFIKKFCKKHEKKEEDIRKNKKECKRLKIKCEAAKKLLSENNEAFVVLNNFYDDIDLNERIMKYEFESICKDLFEKIENITMNLLTELGKEPQDFESVILVGGATRMTGIKNMLKRIFGERKIKDNIDPDEAVAFGATLESAKVEKKEKVNFTLQDIIPYNLGIAVLNQNQEEIKKGQKMYTIIKKFSKIPTVSKEHPFKVTLNEKFRDININIYEGNDKYVENNRRLDVITISDIHQIGEIEYGIIFGIDVNSKLIVHINFKSLNRKESREIRKITNAIMDGKKKKIKINKSKLILPMNSVFLNIQNMKQNIYSSTNLNSKLENLIDCSQEYEQLINNYMTFINENDYVLEKIYVYTKELFNLYSERIMLNSQKLVDKRISKKNNIPKIINKIKERMKNLISVVGYVADLLDIFIDVRENSKNEFYQILYNFMELMNNEGNNKMENQKFCRYYSILYFEKAFYCYKKYTIDDDLMKIDRDIKIKLEEQIQKNKKKLYEIKSFATVIESLAKEKQFLVGHTGFTFVLQQLEKLKNLEVLSVDEMKELFDLFQNMVDSYDKKEKSLEEAYCIANIIKILYKIYKDEDKDRLLEYISRFNFIMEGREDEKYNWYKEIKKIIDEIENKFNF